MGARAAGTVAHFTDPLGGDDLWEQSNAGALDRANPDARAVRGRRRGATAAAVCHRGSAYIAGWYGYAEKDLRSILGESPAGAYSRRYCGEGDRAACEQLLRETLLEAIAEPAAVTYEDELCAEDDTPGFEDPQLCFDAIAHTTAGAVTQPLIHWINRPTFQQVVEVGAP